MKSRLFAELGERPRAVEGCCIQRAARQAGLLLLRGVEYRGVLAVSQVNLIIPFLIDQCQQRCCTLFQGAQAKAERARYFWERLRALFLDFQLPDWETLYRALAFGYHGELVLYDTS